MASFVKSKIPNNCIAAGVPAKVKKEHVARGRESGAEFIKEEWDYRDNAMQGKNLC